MKCSLFVLKMLLSEWWSSKFYRMFTKLRRGSGCAIIVLTFIEFPNATYRARSLVLFYSRGSASSRVANNKANKRTVPRYRNSCVRLPRSPRKLCRVYELGSLNLYPHAFWPLSLFLRVPKCRAENTAGKLQDFPMRRLRTPPVYRNRFVDSVLATPSAYYDLLGRLNRSGEHKFGSAESGKKL